MANPSTRKRRTLRELLGHAPQVRHASIYDAVLAAEVGADYRQARDELEDTLGRHYYPGLAEQADHYMTPEVQARW